MSAAILALLVAFSEQEKGTTPGLFENGIQVRKLNDDRFPHGIALSAIGAYGSESRWSYVFAPSDYLHNRSARSQTRESRNAPLAGAR